MSTSSATPTRRGYSLKARLYFIIIFLGLLPILGVGLALFEINASKQDGAVLDRAARGTIYLERVNGLVYATVMECRGIYMSPDWTAAQPFAAQLSHHLDELKEITRAWRIDAMISQQSNVEDLAERIDQFVSFRAELKRLAQAEGTQAARTFGDNDQSRTIRTALNESLQTLTYAYEQEIRRARQRVEVDERDALRVLLSLAGVGAIGLFGGLIFVRTGLLAPVLRVKDEMLRLAHGNLDIEVGGRVHAHEIGEMVNALNVFQRTLKDRHIMNREAKLLSELSEWLQSSNTLEELYKMVVEFIGRLLPGCGGSLYIYANSRDVLECAQVWNGARTTPAIHPDDCWGLRRGRPYMFGEAEAGFKCAHVDVAASQSYYCIPILAHGDTIGLLHLEFDNRNQAIGPAAGRQSATEQRRLGLLCAEQISLAIANVKLRDQLRDQSIRDPLTGLYNRRYTLETCRREFSRAARIGQSISILSIDVDHFKTFNDNHGHDAGDMVLRAVGHCLEQTFRNEDVPCRFGGEEFIVVLLNADLDVAARRAEQLRAKVEAIVVRYGDRNLPRITVSIGVAAYPDSGDDPQTVFKAADDALYRAKAEGRNRIALSSTNGGNFGDTDEKSTALPLVLAGGIYVTESDSGELEATHAVPPQSLPRPRAASHDSRRESTASKTAADIEVEDTIASITTG